MSLTIESLNFKKNDNLPTKEDPLREFVNENGLKIVEVIRPEGDFDPQAAFTNPTQIKVADVLGNKIEGEWYEIKKHPAFQYAVVKFLAHCFPVCPIERFQDPNNPNSYAYFSHNKPLDDAPIVTQKELNEMVYKLAVFFGDFDHGEAWKILNEFRRDKSFELSGKSYERFHTNGDKESFLADDLDTMLLGHNINRKKIDADRSHIRFFDFDRIIEYLKISTEPTVEEFRSLFIFGFNHSNFFGKESMQIDIDWLYNKLKEIDFFSITNIDRVIYSSAAWKILLTATIESILANNFYDEGHEREKFSKILKSYISHGLEIKDAVSSYKKELHRVAFRELELLHKEMIIKFYSKHFKILNLKLKRKLDIDLFEIIDTSDLKTALDTFRESTEFHALIQELTASGDTKALEQFGQWLLLADRKISTYNGGHYF
jgi:hypothetical protein